MKPRRRLQRERQKTIGLMSKTTTLHVHHTFLYISLPLLHIYAEMPTSRDLKSGDCFLFHYPQEFQRPPPPPKN